MKKIIIAIIFCAAAATSNAQFLKKLKDKVNKTVDKSVGKAIGTDKPQSEIEKKEDAASDQYSDATENNEKPIFVDVAPANGRLVLKMKKDDRFWGGDIQLKGQPGKKMVNQNILDYVKARVVSFFTRGEVSENAIYADGKRMLMDTNTVPLRQEFISIDKNKAGYFSSTETKVGSQPDMSAIQSAVASGQSPSKAEMDKYESQLKGMTTLPTFTFTFDGKTYGPFTGLGEMFLKKSLDFATKLNGFWGLGNENYYDEKSEVFIINAIIQTGNKLLRFKDYNFLLKNFYEPIDLQPLSFPAGAMVIAQGKASYKFSNGKTIAVPPTTSFPADAFPSVLNRPIMYGTDSGHLVIIPMEKVSMVNDKPQVEKNKHVYIDYKTILTYPIEVNKKEHLLVAGNLSKSVYYNQHTLYYADGQTEPINNCGNAQLISFNGKDYIVWFEVMKVEDGHEIYVCQKELK